MRLGVDMLCCSKQTLIF